MLEEKQFYGCLLLVAKKLKINLESFRMNVRIWKGGNTNMNTGGVQYYYFFNEMFAQYVKSNESRRNKKARKQF